MYKNYPFKLFFFSCITSLFATLLYGCNNKELNPNIINSNNQTVEKIQGVAALGQLNPLGEIRKLAAPTSARGGTPRLSKL